MKSATPLDRRHFVLGSGSALALLVAGQGTSHAAAARTHRFLCCDYQGNKVAIVAADGSVEWEFVGKTPQDCWLLPNGNVLFCHLNGAKEVSPNKQVVWEYKAPAEAMCHSCQPLSNGNVLVAECGMSRIVEVGKDGKLAKAIKIDSQPKIV